jgi:UDP-N-acetylglucosamine 1-carboxyvinyltransferase
MSLEVLELVGGRPLRGTLRVSGAKNAALPMLLASLLSSGECIFSNVPNLSDISLIEHLLQELGAEVYHELGTVKVKADRIVSTEASYSLVKALRASFWALAPLLARCHKAQVALPGGDIIGARPVDIHLEALQKMGADVKVRHGIVFAEAPRGLRPADLTLRFPSVGATHQILMASALTPGTTVIRGAAKEPEVVALAEFLSAMGVGIDGAGSENIAVTGVNELNGAKAAIIGDRIEAGTFLLAAAATGGSVRVEGFCSASLGEFSEMLCGAGLCLTSGDDFIEISRNGPILPLVAQTKPFPGFATDLQAPLMALLSLASGTSTIEESIYEGRFGHVAELCRMGADIIVAGRSATIKGVPALSGAPVEAFDIRAAACLVIAGLAAEGTTTIAETEHIRRGYERLESKLRSLGAQVRFARRDIEDLSFTGC